LRGTSVKGAVSAMGVVPAQFAAPLPGSAVLGRVTLKGGRGGRDVGLDVGTRVVEGDVSSAFRAFYDDALPQVYGYVLHRCGGIRTVAEDLTQETFLVAVRALQSGDAASVTVAWLIGVARHKLLDYFRGCARDSRKLTLLQGAAAVDDELLDWHGRASREQAMAALAELPPSQRAAMVLRYFDDLPVPEVARALGRSVHATESLLARGRDGFKRRFLEAGNA